MNEPGAASAPPPRYGITKHGLSMPLEILGLSKTPTVLADVVIIAIDFEGIDTVRSGFAPSEDSQVGFAILDIKVLRQPEVSHQRLGVLRQPEFLPATELISTSNFATGTPSYVARTSSRFSFGDTVAIPTSSILHTIQLHIPQDRNVLLIGYGIINDLRALQDLGFKQPRLGILDTRRIANEVLGIWNGSLSDLLTTLVCPFDRLHVAGNDAHFTLKALLLLAVKWCVSQGQEDYEVLDTLLDISYSPTSSIRRKNEAAEKKERRLARSRKHQSRSWNKEKQDHIRVTRERQRRQHIDGEEAGDYMFGFLLELDGINE